MYKVIIAEIRAFIAETFFVGDVKYGDDDGFYDTGIIDSTGMLELVSFVEERYNIKVEDSDMRHEYIGTLESLAGLVLDKKEENDDNN